MKPTFLVMQNFGHPLFKTVDFTKAIGHFVVVDPMDPSHLLYLTPRGYQDLLKVIISNDGALVVLARPEDNLSSISDSSKPSSGSSDQHNPPIGEGNVEASGDLSPEALSPPETLDKGPVLPSMPHPLANAITREEFESLSESTKRDIERHFRVKRSQADFSSIWETAKNQFARFLYRGLINPESRFLGLSDRNIRNLFLHWGIISSVRLGWNLSSLSLRLSIIPMASHLLLIFKNNGINSMILRLKVSLFAMYSFIAGSPLTDTRHLGLAVGLSNGLPTWFPSSFRARIRCGDLLVIRTVATLIASYKAIGGVWSKPTLETIRNAPFLKDLDSINGFLPMFWKWLFSKSPKNIRFPDLNTKRSPFSVKTGANFYLAPLSAVLDILAWQKSPRHRLIEFILAARQISLMTVFVKAKIRCESTSIAQVLDAFRVVNSEKGFLGEPPKYENLRLGKLSLKHEAAGKVRVFAIVDFWTHLALYPLHIWMFDLLKSLPMDGTFDQDQAVKSFANSFGNTKVFSFDLSAATDNIPVALTTRILAYSLGPRVAKAWELLLVDRDFKVPKGKQGVASTEPNYVRYGRGQPMGALSSWASLALTHHFLVQLAAMRVDQFPYEGYRVLGDDIVISGQEVADSYVQICSEFEIPINNKGIISDPARSVRKGFALTNFANKYYLGIDDVSPISLKDEISITSLSQRIESVIRLVNKGC